MASTTNKIVGGSFQDVEGNVLANGYLLFRLNQDAIVNTSTKICSGLVIKVMLDDTGNVPSSADQQLWTNDVLSPSTTFYFLSAYTASGQLVYGPNPVLILSTPSPFSLGTIIPGDINA